jgi:DNA-binding NarL/FixJ family response regulator
MIAHAPPANPAGTPAWFGDPSMRGGDGGRGDGGGTGSHGAQPSKGRVLVIDDSELVLGKIKQVLTAEGYEVTTTPTAVGNARHIPNHDLVIIDFHMPGIDGGTVIASLRAAATARGHAALFYLYTSDPTAAKRATELGFDGYFPEKGNWETLVREVRAVFRLAKMRAMKR